MNGVLVAKLKSGFTAGLAALVFSLAASGCVDNPDRVDLDGRGEVVDVGGQEDVGGDDGEQADQPDVADPDLAEPIEPLPTGSACSDGSECETGVCLTGPDWPEGFCTVAGCPESNTCGAGEGCADQPMGGTYCTPECGSDDECRLGYSCGYVVPGSFRNPPEGPRVCMPPRGLADGEPCDGRGDCSGFCLTDWPDGYCSTFGCETSDDCARQGHDNVCLGSGRYSQCVRSCTGSEDCREGYICDDIGDQTMICVPDPARPFDPAVFEPGPLNITCGHFPENGEVSFDYEVAPETTAYMVTPMTRDGEPLQPDRITMPSGNSLSFVLGNAFQAVGAQLYASMNPTIIPATSDRIDHVESGAHTYSLTTDSAEVCYYLLEEELPGDSIDLNIYLVGVPGITPANAASDPDLAEVLAEFETIYAQADISLGEVRYFELGPEDTARFEVVRSDSEVEELVKRSVSPGDDLDSALSVNIFFAGQFAMRGAIGISAGLPGAAGLHGTHGSGVVFTAEYMGTDVEDGFGDTADGNAYTGQIMAHEVGHFLGLFHTSESTGRSFDPLTDTPECTRISASCPDVNNLMFPFAGSSNVDVSEQQGFVIGVNPLTRLGATDPGE